MNPTGKRFISLFLVFSLMTLSVNLNAKKRGAKLVITKKDGTQFKGELILVKQNSLLMFPSKRKNIQVDIKFKDIEKIVIVKKSKVGSVAKIGGLIGCCAGCSLGTKDEYEPLGAMMVYAPLGGIIGLLVGASLGIAVIPNKVILIEGMTDAEIREALDYLR